MGNQKLSNKIEDARDLGDFEEVIRVEDIKESLKELRKELLETLDDVQSDWSWLVENYNNKFDEIVGDALK